MSWIRLQSKIFDEPSNKDKDVNDCEAEDAEKCWEITPANLATMDTTLSVRQNVLALGKIPYLTSFKLHCIENKPYICVSTYLYPEKY